MHHSVCNLPFNYDNTPERRVLDLEREGIPCVPALGYSHYTRCRPSVSEHIHPGCLELTLCMRGSLVFECGGRDYRLLPGNVFVTQPDERHRLSTNPKGLVMFWLFFRLTEGRPSLLNLPAAEAAAFRRALQTMPSRLFKGSVRMRQAFQRLFKLHDELAPGPYRSLTMRSSVLELMLALIEAAQTPEEVAAEGGRIDALISAMRRAPEKAYSIDAMARTAALSPSQLIARFKKATGLPPYNFLLSCRILKARRQLLETEQPITQIAQACGFSSSQHFAMQFKREFGITPSALRKGQPPLILPG